MSRSIVFILGVCVFTAQSAIYKTRDVTYSRKARSPHYGLDYLHDDNPPPPPPPPPIVYRTQNWSGVAKGIGGTPQGVFSGAAASAGSPDLLNSEAYSVAASGTDSSTTDEVDGQTKGESAAQTSSSGYTSFGGSEKNYGAETFGSHSSSKSENCEGQSDKYNGETSTFNKNTVGNGQYNIKLDGLDYGAAGGTSEDYESKSDQYNVHLIRSAGFDKKSAGRDDVGISSGRYNDNSAGYDGQSAQRGFDSGIGGKSFGSESKAYESRSTQYGSLKGIDEKQSKGTLTAGSLETDVNSARSEDFDSQSGRYNVQSSKVNSNANKGTLAGYGSRSDQYNSESSSFGRKAIGRELADSNKSGQQQLATAGEFSAGSYNNGDGYISSHSSGFGDSNRHRKDHKESSFGSNGANYESGSSGRSEVSYFDKQEQEQLNAGLNSNNEAESQTFSGAQSQSSSVGSGSGYDKSLGRKQVFVAGNENSGISSSSTNKASGSLSTGIGVSGQADLQSALGGALSLASQGLQTALQTPCSSCDKSSYALSNAKSRSGSAIALSIGG